MVAQIDPVFKKKSKLKTYTRLLSYLFYEGRPLTTKGRWINPFVFFFYKVQEYIPTSKAVMKPIFILGTGRSGTTILGVTLGIHRDVGFLNEPKAFWAHISADDDLIGSYHKKVGKYHLSETDVNEVQIKKAHTIYSNYLRASFSSRIVDKYPEMIFRSRFLCKIFPDAKYLFLYRNGWDTCHSIDLWSKRLGCNKNDESHDWWGLNDRKWLALCEQVVKYDEELVSSFNLIKEYKNHVFRAAVEWIVTMKHGLALINNESVMAIKYEDFVRDSNYRESVLEFCDLKPDENFTSYCQEVLKPPKQKELVELPVEIHSEFIRVMRLLGYEK